MPDLTNTAAHLSAVLGDDNYRRLANTGTNMTNARHGDLRARTD
jgi:hypothetical protein